MTAERLDSPRKIAVLQANALGDFIMTLPALTAIKQTYPDAELTLLVRPWLKDFLNRRPSPADKLVSIPSFLDTSDTSKTKKRVKTDTYENLEAPETERFFRSTRRERFDVALSMESDIRTANAIITQLGAKLTAGAQNSHTAPLDRFIPYAHYQNAILRNIEIASLIGVQTIDFDPHVEITVHDTREMADILESFGNEPFVVLHPGATQLHLRWPPVKFAAVADMLNKRGFLVILTGEPKDKPLITEIIQYMQSTAFAQTSLSIGGLAALLDRSSLVIGNDSGPLHLARAVGTRTVGISWAPGFLNREPLFSKHHRTAVSWQLTCPKCGVKPSLPFANFQKSVKCSHSYSFVDSVPISEVISLATEVLEDIDQDDVRPSTLASTAKKTK